jgi:hypothetical protein
MSAYMIVNVDLHDPAAYDAYKQAVPALIARHGGEPLVRGGASFIPPFSLRHKGIGGSWGRFRKESGEPSPR